LFGHAWGQECSSRFRSYRWLHFDLPGVILRVKH
jgi:hypothetical protein